MEWSKELSESGQIAWSRQRRKSSFSLGRRTQKVEGVGAGSWRTLHARWNDTRDATLGRRGFWSGVGRGTGDRLDGVVRRLRPRDLDGHTS